MESECIMSSLQRSLAETMSQKEHLPNIVEEAVQGIKRRTTFLHAAVDELSETLKKEVLQMETIEMQRLRSHEEKLQELIEYFTSKDLKTDPSNNITKSNHHFPDVVRAISVNDDTVSWIQKLTEFEHVCLHFKEGSMSKTDILPMFGSIENYHIRYPSFVKKDPPINSPKFAIKMVAEFKCNEPNTNIHAILPISETEAWICCGWGSNSIHLYDSSGVKHVSLDLDIRADDLCMTSSGDILISSYNGNVIKRVDENLQVTTFAELSFSPRGMVVTGIDEIYVCGVNRKCSSKTDVQTCDDDTNQSQHLIAKLSNKGKLISMVNVPQHDPHRLAVDADGNIVFSDYGLNKRRQFVVVDSSGEVKVTYKGPHHIELENPFYPLGVCRDRYGYTLISDWNNDCIHLLDTDFNFIRFLVNDHDDLECPNALSIDREDQLWVGEGTGFVKIFRYVN